MALGTLYLVPNLLGLTPPEHVLPVNTIQIASRLQYFLVETPKAARQFLKTLPLLQPLQSLVLHEIPESATRAEWDALLEPLVNGGDMGVLSDAGCPGVADPGALVVAEVHRRGGKVVPLVGPSSILLGLMASGFNGQQFLFHGYLPADTAGRAMALKKLQEDIRKSSCTHIFIETPYRNIRLLADILSVFHPQTEVAIATALTTPEEYIVRGSVERLKTQQAHLESVLNRQPALFMVGKDSRV
ncbi:MAG: SAM-dependent methyltransferase [Pseudomonadota bacterium]